MGNKVLYAINMKRVITDSIYACILGLILSVVPLSSLVGLIIVVIGLVLIVSNGYKLYVEFKEKKDTTEETLFLVLNTLFGFVLIAFQNKVVTIGVALYLIAIPVYEVIKSKFNKGVIMEKAPHLLVGGVLLLGGFVMIDFIFKILGILIIVGSICYLGFNYYLYKKSGVKVIK